MKRFEEGLDVVGAKLDPDVVADFFHPGTEAKPKKGVILRFREARDAQLAAKAAASEAKATVSETRVTLEQRLMDNLLIVAQDGQKASDEEKEELLRLFPHHFLRARSRRSKSQSEEAAVTDAETPESEDPKVTPIESAQPAAENVDNDDQEEAA